MRLRPHQRARVEFLLREGTREAAEEAHALARNDGDLHLRVHLALARLALREGRRQELGFQLWQALMAPSASFVRRRAGYRPEQPNEGGLWQTWKVRPERSGEPG